MMGLIPKPTDPKTTVDSNHTFCIYGPPGGGKTTFCAGLEDSLIIDTEKGSDFQEAHRVGCPDWATFVAICTELARTQPKYQHLCIDTLGPLLNSCMNFVSAKLKVTHPSEAQYGKGWHLIKETVKQVLLQLQHMPYHLWLIVHTQTKKIEGLTTYDYTQPELPGFLEQLVISLCDFVMLADVESQAERNADGKMIGRKDVHILRTKPSKHWMAKDRLVKTTLPEVLELNPKKFMLTLKATQTLTKDGATSD
jgi:hypothetical protein